MFKLLINERFYIYNNSKIFKISEKVILTKRLLRIAQIAPPEFSVPPKTYGGIERTISYLTEELVKRGHDVTLFATTDSITSAKLVAKWPAFNKSSAPMERYEWTYDQVRKNVTKFDILHFHTDEILEVIDDIVKENKTSCVVTIHTPIEWYTSLGTEYNRIPIITISDEQKLHASGKPNFAGTAYHGLPKEHYKFIEYPKGKKPYLAFLGRMVPEKQPDMAIEIAVKAGYNLKMAAKVNKDDKYWKETIKPLIEANKNSVEFIGEINDKQKNEFLGNALAFIFPINWNEQFGMVMIESMACGTPVIARRMGSVPEIIENGISGIIFNTVEEGVEAVKKATKINRKAVREAFERRFTIEKNVDRIEEIYKKILKMREG